MYSLPSLPCGPVDFEKQPRTLHANAGSLDFFFVLLSLVAGSRLVLKNTEQWSSAVPHLCGVHDLEFTEERVPPLLSSSFSLEIP